MTTYTIPEAGRYMMACNVCGVERMFMCEKGDEIRTGCPFCGDPYSCTARTAVGLKLQPISRDEACAFIQRHHRHHPPPVGWKFGIAASDDGGIVRAVVAVGRPVSRHCDDGWTAEVTRLCTDGAKNAASMLYAAAWRACRAMGYRRLITYTLDTETGTSLVAAGWKVVGKVKEESWHREARPRVDKHPTQGKLKWETK